MSANLEARLERLYSRRTFGIKLGLETETAILEELGNPHRSCLVVHVAGTNGKGSVCAMIESVLRAAGLKTALYTSPHLVRFNERFRVSGRDIGDDELAAVMDAVEDAADRVRARTGHEATFFESSTAMAFEYFRRAGVEMAVIEVGMGGRLDATNVVDPLVSVITRIDIEHAQHLGGTVAEIAREKGGIVKPGRPVVIGGMPEEAASVIAGIAAANGARTVSASDVGVTLRKRDIEGQTVRIESAGADYGTVRVPLLGPHQLENAATAVAAVETLGECLGCGFTDRQVKSGLEQVRWPGRCQVLSAKPLLVVDGAHNPGAGKVLAGALRSIRRKPWGLVMGMCADKDARGFAAALGKVVERVWLVPVRTERAADPKLLEAAAAAAGWRPEHATLNDAVAAGMRWAGDTGRGVCIAGSLFLAGEALEMAEKGELFR